MNDFKKALFSAFFVLLASMLKYQKLISPNKIMKNRLEDIALKITRWVGSIWSIIVHTLIFIFFMVLLYLGYNPERVMLVLTTLVSLEAIYLALFIQMTVNKHSEHIADIAEDVDEIQEDIDDIQEDIEELNEDEDENETVNPKN